MCLSTVYKINSDQSKELLYSNIANVLNDGNQLTFINLLGKKTTIEGVISKIDLVENCIYINQED